MAEQRSTPPDTDGASSKEPATPTETGEAFYDATTVPDELKGTYKQMQQAYVKKTQALSQQRQKVQAYDAFMSNPETALQQLAQQYGYQITKGGAAAPAQGEPPKDWEPQSWDEVMAKAEERAEQRVLQRLEPFIGELRGLKKTAIEQQLDSTVPDWRNYEDEFADAIRSHPSLVNDPVKLARIALPEEVLESRAMQAALKKLRTQQSSSQGPGGGSTSQARPNEGQPPRGAKSFQEAAQMAAAYLEKEGKLYRVSR